MASYCHTDSMIQSGIFGTALPVTASHEGAGTVVAAGSSSDLKPGDRVMCGLPFHPCGKCPECTGPNEGWRQYCENVEGHCGVHRDGFFAGYAVCDARTSTKLPDEISLLSAAPLACAGRTVWRGVEQAGLKEGQWLAIVGSGGGLGHLGVQFAKKKGLKVIGIDARDDGLEVSKALGADIVIDARKGKEAAVKEVHEATRDANPGNLGVDATVTLSDASTAAALGCAITKKHGTMVQVAQPKDVVIPFSEFVFRDITVKGSVVSSPGESDAMVSDFNDRILPPGYLGGCYGVSPIRRPRCSKVAFYFLLFSSTSRNGKVLTNILGSLHCRHRHQGQNQYLPRPGPD